MLWSLTYEQYTTSASAQVTLDPARSSILRFGGPALDTVFDEEILNSVKEAWKTITGQSDDDFMKFEDRNNPDNDADEL